MRKEGPTPQYHAEKTTAAHTVWYGLWSPKTGASSSRRRRAVIAASIARPYRRTFSAAEICCVSTFIQLSGLKSKAAAGLANCERDLFWCGQIAAAHFAFFNFGHQPCYLLRVSNHLNVCISTVSLRRTPTVLHGDRPSDCSSIVFPVEKGRNTQFIYRRNRECSGCAFPNARSLLMWVS